MREPNSKQAPNRTILVPLDGSRAAEAALPAAFRLAAALGADVLLLRVVAEQAQAGAAEAYLGAISSTEAPLRIEVRSGKATAVIEAAAGEPGVALVVLSTSGEGGDARHLGGVAERLSRTLTAPALFVPPSSTGDPPLAGPVLIALHGSAASETAIEPAVAFAQPLQAQVTLVQVAPWAEGLFANFLGVPPPNADEEIELGSNRYLAGLAEQLSNRVAADYQTLRGRAANMLVEYAESVGGWLVLASHAHHGPHLWGLGSTSDKVLRASRTPVLIVRVEEGDAEARPLESATPDEAGSSAAPSTAAHSTAAAEGREDG